MSTANQFSGPHITLKILNSKDHEINEIEEGSAIKIDILLVDRTGEFNGVEVESCYLSNISYTEFDPLVHSENFIIDRGCSVSNLPLFQNLFSNAQAPSTPVHLQSSLFPAFRFSPADQNVHFRCLLRVCRHTAWCKKPSASCHDKIRRKDFTIYGEGDVKFVVRTVQLRVRNFEDQLISSRIKLKQNPSSGNTERQCQYPLCLTLGHLSLIAASFIVILLLTILLMLLLYRRHLPYCHHYFLFCLPSLSSSSHSAAATAAAGGMSSSHYLQTPPGLLLDNSRKSIGCGVGHPLYLHHQSGNQYQYQQPLNNLDIVDDCYKQFINIDQGYIVSDPTSFYDNSNSNTWRIGVSKPLLRSETEMGYCLDNIYMNSTHSQPSPPSPLLPPPPPAPASSSTPPNTTTVSNCTSSSDRTAFTTSMLLENPASPQLYPPSATPVTSTINNKPPSSLNNSLDINKLSTIKSTNYQSDKCIL